MCGPQTVSPSTVNGIGLATQIGGSIMGAYGAYNKAGATRDSYNAQAGFENMRADYADIEARSAIQAGQQQSFKSGLNTGQLEGTQRAVLAARGINLDTGSALNTLLDTKYMGSVDRATIADNAAKEAWALHNTAAIDRANAAMYSSAAGKVNPALVGGTSLLTSAGPVAQSWYKFSKSTGTPSTGSTETWMGET